MDAFEDLVQAIQDNACGRVETGSLDQLQARLILAGTYTGWSGGGSM
jgi:hypothetical protein